MEKTSPFLNNYFDYDKWLMMYDPQQNEVDQATSNSPVKTKLPNPRLKSQTSNPTETIRTDNNLLSKSQSTAHIPHL